MAPNWPVALGAPHPTADAPRSHVVGRRRGRWRRGRRPVRRLAAAGLIALLRVPELPAQSGPIEGISDLCADRPVVYGERGRNPFRRNASDLNCVDLHPTATAKDATGVVELGRVATPYGVAVTPAGHQIYELTAWVTGLPPTDQVYVAWATTPYLDPTVKLGEVRNGQNALGRVQFNKFLILVTREPSPDVELRAGPLILRGRSPSSYLEAHDLLAQAPMAVLPPPPTPPSTSNEPARRAAAAPETAEAGNPDTVDVGWEMPPMYPDIPVLPGLIGRVPTVDPLLPRLGTTKRIPQARPPRRVRLGDGGTLDLVAGPVLRQLKGRTLLMYAFNGQHPGPLIQVPEKSTVFVNFTNETPFPTSVHWHGVRLDNRFDGVPGVTQEPVKPDGTFRYQIYFRDAGIYWYHPHHREDVQQELGLYGNVRVDPGRPDYFNPVNREEVVLLDDLLLDDDGIVPFGEQSANYSLMGRFGNVLLVNGEPSYELNIESGEVVRFFFTNASNTRTFNLSLLATTETNDEPLPLKVVGSDVGPFEREQRVRNVVIAPAERYVVEAHFASAGEYRLTNRVQAIDHRRGIYFPEIAELGLIRVEGGPPAHDHSGEFERLRERGDVIADIDRYRRDFDRPVDHELILSLDVADLPRPVEQVMLYDWIYFNPVEWAGTMPMMNWLTTGNEIRWILRDPETGKENTEIDWRFKLGDVVKIRLRNDRSAFHAMQHPLHIHGQRFLVLTQNGVPNDNLVWKDTVLLPVGSTTDILLELSNPGRWMVHCHIAEHLEAGMKLVMQVE